MGFFDIIQMANPGGNPLRRVASQTPLLNFLGYFFAAGKEYTQEVLEGEFEGEAFFRRFPLKKGVV